VACELINDSKALMSFNMRLLLSLFVHRYMKALDVHCSKVIKQLVCMSKLKIASDVHWSKVLNSLSVCVH